MSRLKQLLLLSALPLSMIGQSALAQNITVSGQLTTYPVKVQAQNTGCYGASPIAFGYSVDNQTMLTQGSTAYAIDTTDQSITAGNHTIHFKSWTSQGICPVLDVATTVGGTTTGPVASSPIPSYATPSVDLDASTRWQWNHDGGTPGSSVGSTTFAISNPSVDQLARKFDVSYSDRGGEIYHLSFANDSSATHFVYDTYVYLPNPSQMKNLELDMNQVMANGRTVILGTQCSGYSGTWEYVKVWSGAPHWNKSNIPCDPENWSANTWHHVQIATHRDQYGNATYDWVNFDGKLTYFSGASGAASLALGWQPGDLLVNVQLDGSSVYSGSIQMYLDKLKVYRW